MVSDPNLRNSNIEIYDLFGRLVYNTRAIAGTLTINDHNLASGIYFVTVANETVKLIIK